MRTERRKEQTDTAKLIFVFRRSVKARKKNQYLSAKHSCVPKSLESGYMYAFKWVVAFDGQVLVVFLLKHKGEGSLQS
jgi:hypothetical protein